MSALRVGFDYWPAATHAPGIGRYLRELVRALAQSERGPRLALLDFGPEGENVPESALGLDARGIVRRRIRARRGWLRASERFGVRAETWLGTLDVFHRARLLGPPTARAPQVVALSELPSENEAAVREALRRVAAVLVFSEHARDELLRRFGARPEQVQRVPVGCDHWLRDFGARTAARDRVRLLVLGAVRRERGHVEILQAFERSCSRGLDADLVFCGRRGDEAARLDGALRSSPVRTRVRWIDEPLESEMPALVAG
ncbi:MAG TPA: hypothetical protein VM509_02105, partial [Planctomycetota bacterium]|nr:hypothetical protein [Planctomycetota bacterium]